MRIRMLLAALAGALVAVPLVFAATGIKARLIAPAANPKICAMPSDIPSCRWRYTIKLTDLKGRRLAGRLTAVIIDPFGGTHPVGYGPSDPEKPITNWPFKGTFRDYLEFPPESKGFKLKIRWTIKAKIKKKMYKKVLTRTVVPER
jgi:hypothetical protein